MSLNILNKTIFFLWLSLFNTSIFASCIGLGCNCTITTNSINFGFYDIFSLSPIDTTSTLSVTCGSIVVGANISYEVQLSFGSSGSYAVRTMQNGANTLNYNLYTDASRTTIWGNGTSSTGVITNSYILTLIFSRKDDFTIYARIPALQNVAVGNYTDTIVGTVVF